MHSRLVLLAIIVTIQLISQQCKGNVLTENIYKLGPKLYHLLSDSDSKEVPDNFIASPLGLTLGLALIELGASYSLKQLIREEIFDWHSDNFQSFQSNVTAIQRLLQSTYSHDLLNVPVPQSKGLEGPVNDLKDVELNIQCAIFHREGINLTTSFHQMAVDNFDSQVITLNSSLKGEEQQLIVNQWARNATKDLIQEFPVPQNLSVLLANTVYFEGDWTEPFAKEYTRLGDFKPTENPNHTMRIPYLLGQQDVPYYESELFKMIRLSYVIKQNSSKDIAMFVVLPRVKEVTLTDVIDKLTFAHFRDIVKEKMLEWTVNIKLPKLSARRRLNVKEVMDTLYSQDRNNRRWSRSVRQNHSSNDYQLSSASDNPQFVLTDFIQDTVLEVNEKGTRAASISGGYINYDSLSKTFRCDRPYLIIIYDVTHDVVLFWAAIHRPNVNSLF